jgi:hypothetical protein
MGKLKYADTSFSQQPYEHHKFHMDSRAVKPGRVREGARRAFNYLSYIKEKYFSMIDKLILAFT